MSATRIETDSFGSIEVPADALWGAQTARSLHFFAIGEQRMPLALVHALAWIKWAAALVNLDLHLLDPQRALAIADAARAVAQGRHDDAFPLSVWQTGSGTQTNMNVNEVVARLATTQQPCGAGTPVPIHPNDEVNLGQSSNDVFPSAMHIAVAIQSVDSLLPSLDTLRNALADQARRLHDTIKIGRTHLQDATPVRMGQEFGGYEAQLALCEQQIRHAVRGLQALAIGGTAVGTGLNTHGQFGQRVAERLSAELGLPLVQSDNLFAAMAGHEALVAFHGSLKMLAVALTKIGNDIRLMGSGPRAGLGELRLPANEPGSSIMPGKVNPTQIEALTMVCAQIFGHDVAIGFAASQGHFELNAYKPLIVYDTLDSLRLLSDAMRSFATHCVAGIQPNDEQLQRSLRDSLMLVTALAPHIGYDQAAHIAKRAHHEGTSLRDAALALGLVTAENFDRWVDPTRMLAPAADDARGGDASNRGRP